MKDYRLLLKIIRPKNKKRIPPKPRLYKNWGLNNWPSDWKTKNKGIMPIPINSKQKPTKCLNSILFL
jgi:hypothetical protein